MIHIITAARECPPYFFVTSTYNIHQPAIATYFTGGSTLYIISQGRETIDVCLRSFKPYDQVIIVDIKPFDDILKYIAKSVLTGEGYG